MRKTLIKLISSIFYLGYLPLRGTLASILAIVIYLVFKDLTYLYLLIVIISILLGFLVSGEAEIIYKEKDSKKIVIDDLCGMLFSLILFPKKPYQIIGVFLVFRILDFLKPYPADKVEEIPGKGVMLDDFIAALYTNLIYLLFLLLKNYFQ